MNTPHELIDQISGTFQNKIQKVTEPLWRNFGINYFCYQRVDNAGNWTLLSNNALWLHHSAERQFYLHDPSLVDPNYYQSGLNFPEYHQNKGFQDTLAKDSMEFFDFHHTLAIVERQSDCCEYYFLTAPKEHAQAYGIYLNNIYSIRYLYTQYFKEELAKPIQLMSDYSVNVKALKKELYLSDDNVLAISDYHELGANFVAEISHKNQYQKLTPRELDCLQLYRLGKTAKETAKLLSISPRTVEYHINNIKSKYQCKSKNELFNIII